MSAPKTDIDKQERNHKPSLLGIRSVLTYAAILLVGMIVWLVWNGNEPGTEQTPAEGAPSTVQTAQ